MQEPATILFVCVENARRSQMAESIFNELARKKGLKVRAVSAGTMPSKDIDPNVVKVLDEICIRIENQKPKSLTNEMIVQADKIVTMGCMSKEVCPSVFIDRTEDWDIEDPKGRTIEKVREIRDAIKAKVETLVCQLSEN
jgi:protein-tyrosine-phosphatase